MGLYHASAYPQRVAVSFGDSVERERCLFHSPVEPDSLCHREILRGRCRIRHSTVALTAAPTPLLGRRTGGEKRCQEPFSELGLDSSKPGSGWPTSFANPAT